MTEFETKQLLRYWGCYGAENSQSRIVAVLFFVLVIFRSIYIVLWTVILFANYEPPHLQI